MTTAQATVITVDTTVTNNDVPIANGSGGFAWGAQSGGGPNVAMVESTPQHFYVLPGVGSDSNTGYWWDRALATLAQALTNAQAVGAAHIHIGPGSITLPTTATVGMSEVLIEGIPGATTLAVPAAATAGFKMGFDTFTSGGGIYTDVHLRNLIIDGTGATNSGKQLSTMVVGAVERWSIERCILKGGTYCLDVGADLLPSQYGRVVGNTIIVAPVSGDTNAESFTPTNVDGLDFSENTIIIQSNPGSAPCGIDCEPNEVTDSLRGLVIARNKIYGNGLGGGIQVQPGTGTDPERLRGVQILDNQFFDCNDISITVPGVIVRGNRQRFTIAYPSGSFPAGGIVCQQGGDEATIEGNMLDNMSSTGTGTGGYAAVTLQDVSRCTVRDNKVHDTNTPSNTLYGVQEIQSAAVIQSGFAIGTPSTLTVPVSAGQLQQSGLGSLVEHAAQTVTITTANTYARVDLIVVDTTSGVASVVAGSNVLQTGLNPAAPNTPNGKLPLAQVPVAANATSVTANGIVDVRPFAPNNNIIDQPPIVPPPQLGTVLLAGSNSRRIARVPKSPAAYVTAEQAYVAAVLVDAPVFYSPMLEGDGNVLADVSGWENPAQIFGGVLLNQQMGSSGIYGPTFDGSTGYCTIQRLPNLVIHGAYTLEAQILPANNSAIHRIVAQGFDAINDERQFEWIAWNDGTVHAYFPSGSSAVSTSTLSTTAIQHVVLTYDGATTVKMYFNGSADASSPFTITNQSSYWASQGTPYSTWPVFIGIADGTGALPPADSPFNGFIRHVAIYNFALSSTRVSAHFALMP